MPLTTCLNKDNPGRGKDAGWNSGRVFDKGIDDGQDNKHQRQRETRMVRVEEDPRWVGDWDYVAGSRHGVRPVRPGPAVADDG